MGLFNNLCQKVGKVFNDAMGYSPNESGSQRYDNPYQGDVRGTGSSGDPQMRGLAPSRWVNRVGAVTAMDAYIDYAEKYEFMADTMNEMMHHLQPYVESNRTDFDRETHRAVQNFCNAKMDFNNCIMHWYNKSRLGYYDFFMSVDEDGDTDTFIESIEDLVKGLMEMCPNMGLDVNALKLPLMCKITR